MVAHIPYDAVMGCIEYVVQCNRQFDHAQAGAKVPARAGHGIQQIVPQLVSYLHQRLSVETCQRTQICRDGVQ